MEDDHQAIKIDKTRRERHIWKLESLPATDARVEKREGALRSEEEL